MARNSDFTGSVASTAIIFMQSSSGSPALTPRTMMSTASGKALRNFASRRFLRNDNSQRGRPKAPAKPKPAAAGNPEFPSRPAMNITTPMTIEITMYFCFDQLNPACAMRTDSDTFLFFLCRSSTSLREFSTDSRRDLGWLRTARDDGVALATVATRCSVFFSPDRIG